MYKKGCTKKIFHYYNGAHGPILMQYRQKETVVDGYNLIHNLFRPSKGEPFEPLRRRLESLLAGYRRAQKTPVTVVYDGDGRYRDHDETGEVHVVYTARRKSADQWIIDYAKSLNSTSKILTIVSSDNEVRRYSAAFGAKCMSSADFAAMLLPGYIDSSPSGEPGLNRRKFSANPLPEREVDGWMQLFGGNEA
jgi:predicted RNA-binding protein with PIN domain